MRLNPAGENLALAVDIEYRPFGPASNMVLGNTVSMSKAFDLNYQLTDLFYANGSVIMDRAYTPDNVGNITGITDNQDPSRSQSFAYDDLYRLTQADGNYGTINYTYDRVGNRLTRTTAADQDAYTYYSGTNRLETVVGTHAEWMAYDADGNTTQRIPGAANPQPAVAEPRDYTYNSSGQRTIKQATGSVVCHFDQASRLIAETDETGTMIKAYVWLHGLPLAMLAADGSVYYYHNDHLGTPQRMTDATATVVWAADYLSFGQANVTVGTVENNLRFAGQYFDSETGLHYNYHRYYDPKIGRYLRADPAGIMKGLNHLYAYAQNNPLLVIDPFGLKCTLIDSVTKESFNRLEEVVFGDWIYEDWKRFNAGCWCNWYRDKKIDYTDTYTYTTYNAYECVKKDECGKKRKYYKFETDVDEYIDEYSKYGGREYRREYGGVVAIGEGVESGSGCSPAKNLPSLH